MAIPRLYLVVAIFVFGLFVTDAIKVSIGRKVIVKKETLSKEAIAIIDSVKEKLEKSLSDQCKPMIDVAVALAMTDDQVYDMCNLVKGPTAKSSVLSNCTEDDYEEIVKTICDELNTTSKDNNDKLSKEAIAIIDSVKEKLEKSLSDKCKPMIDVAAALAQTDKQVYDMCNLVKGPMAKSAVSSMCSDDDYDKIVKTICDELKATSKDNNNNDKLSKEAIAIIDSVKEKLEKSLSDKCKPMIDVAADLAQTDKQVYDMCSLVSGPLAKPIVLSKCEQEDYDKIVETICKVLNDTTDNVPTKTISKEIKTVVANLIKKLTSTLSGTCKVMSLRTLSSVSNGDEIFALCKKETVKKAYMKFCTKEQYEQIKKNACDEYKKSGEENTDGNDKENTSDNKLSENASTLLKTIGDQLKKELSKKCQPLVSAAVSSANTDKKVSDMCSLVTKQYKNTIISACSQSDYDKVSKIVCEKVKDFKIPKKGNDPNKLSKEAEKTLSKIEKRIGAMSKTCKAKWNKMTDTDELVTNLCSTMDDTKSDILKYCSADEYNKIVESACQEVKKLKQDRMNRVLSIGRKLYYYSETCKNLVGSLPDLGTFSKIEALCKDIETDKKSAYQKACQGNEYRDLKKVVCEGGASAMMSSLVIIVLCLVMPLLNKL